MCYGWYNGWYNGIRQQGEEQKRVEDDIQRLKSLGKYNRFLRPRDFYKERDKYADSETRLGYLLFKATQFRFIFDKNYLDYQVKFLDKYKNLQNDEDNTEKKRIENGTVEKLRNEQPNDYGIVHYDEEDEKVYGISELSEQLSTSKLSDEELHKKINKEKDKLLILLKDYIDFMNNFNNINIKNKIKNISFTDILKNSFNNIFNNNQNKNGPIHYKEIIKLIHDVERIITIKISDFREQLQTRTDEINNEIKKSNTENEINEWKKRREIMTIPLNIINRYEIHLRNRVKIIAHLCEIFASREKGKQTEDIYPYSGNDNNNNFVNPLLQKDENKLIHKPLTPFEKENNDNASQIGMNPSQVNSYNDDI